MKIFLTSKEHETLKSFVFAKLDDLSDQVDNFDLFENQSYLNLMTLYFKLGDALERDVMITTLEQLGQSELVKRMKGDEI